MPSKRADEKMKGGKERADLQRDHVKGILRRPEKGAHNFFALRKCFCTGKHREAQQRHKGTDCCMLLTPGQSGYRKRFFCRSSERNRCKRQFCSPGSIIRSHHAYPLPSQHSSTCALCTNNRNPRQLKHACLKGSFCKHPSVGGKSLSGPAEIIPSEKVPRVKRHQGRCVHLRKISGALP